MRVLTTYILTALALVQCAWGAAMRAKVPVLANFDDIKVPIAGFEGNPVPTPYRFLEFAGFAVGSAAPVTSVTLLPSSLPNLAFDRFVRPRVITSKFADSKVSNFDLHTLSSGCYPGTRGGFFAPPTNCTLAFTGTKVDGSKVEKIYDYGVGTIQGFAQTSMPMKPIAFPRSFTNLTSVSIAVTKSIFPPGGGDIIQFAIDDVSYSVEFKKST